MLKEGNHAFSLLQLGLRNAHETGNKLDEAKALGDLSNYHAKGDKNVALICAEQAAELFNTLGYRHEEALCISQAGLLQTELGRREKGIEQILFALEIHRDAKDEEGEVLSVGRLAEAQLYLEEYEEALTTFDQQGDLARKINDRTREAGAIGNKAIALNKLRRFDESIKLSNEAIDIVRSAGNLKDEFTGLCHLARRLWSLVTVTVQSLRSSVRSRLVS